MDMIMQKGLRAKRASLGEGSVPVSAGADSDRSDHAGGAPEGYKAPRLNNNKPSFAKQHQNVAAMLLSDGRVASGGVSSGGSSSNPAGLVLPPAAGLAGLLSQISHRYGRGGATVAVAAANAAASASSASSAASSRPNSNSYRIPHIKNVTTSS
jgi:hypothetical protein